jgi:hypothetical protein
MFVIAFDGELESAMTVAIVYCNKDGFVKDLLIGPRLLDPLFKLQAASMALGPGNMWATFEIIVQLSGEFEVNLQYPEQTDLSRPENYGEPILDMVAERHFPGVPTAFDDLVID